VSVQGKLLRLLEDATYRRTGGADVMEAQCRVISSSNADLLQLIKEGRFRSDLFYRLNAIELYIPSLRSRREDIIPISEHLIAQFARDRGQRSPSLSSAAMESLRRYDWPGNVRELRNRLERAVGATAAAPQIQAQAIFPEEGLLTEPGKRVASLAEVRERAERMHIEEAIRKSGGEIAKAAALLGISRTTLWEKMRKLGVS
jgi:DNA-binding NtrC family response regulator